MSTTHPQSFQEFLRRKYTKQQRAEYRRQRAEVINDLARGDWLLGYLARRVGTVNYPSHSEILMLCGAIAQRSLRFVPSLHPPYPQELAAHYLEMDLTSMLALLHRFATGQSGLSELKGECDVLWGSLNAGLNLCCSNGLTGVGCLSAIEAIEGALGYAEYSEYQAREKARTKAVEAQADSSESPRGPYDAEWELADAYDDQETKIRLEEQSAAAAEARLEAEAARQEERIAEQDRILSGAWLCSVHAAAAAAYQASYDRARFISHPQQVAECFDPSNARSFSLESDKWLEAKKAIVGSAYDPELFLCGYLTESAWQAHCIKCKLREWGHEALLSPAG